MAETGSGALTAERAEAALLAAETAPTSARTVRARAVVRSWVSGAQLLLSFVEAEVRWLEELARWQADRARWEVVR